MPIHGYQLKKTFAEISKKKKIKKTEISRETGLSYYNLTTLDDDWNPRVSTLIKICQALKVKPSSFIYFSLCREVKIENDYIFVSEVYIESLFSQIGVNYNSTFEHLLSLCKSKGMSLENLLKEIESKLPSL